MHGVELRHIRYAYAQFGNKLLELDVRHFK